MKIAVAGLGYVGLSNAILLARHHEVIAVDVVLEKIKMVSAGVSPIADEECERFLSQENLSLKATIDPVEAFSEAEFVRLCRILCPGALFTPSGSDLRT